MRLIVRIVVFSAGFMQAAGAAYAHPGAHDHMDDHAMHFALHHVGVAALGAVVLGLLIWRAVRRSKIHGRAK